jgi:Macrocin-O-methyltransferase (TylF)
LLALGALQSYYRDEKPDRRKPLLRKLDSLLEEVRAEESPDARIELFLRASIRNLEKVVSHEKLQRSGWENELLPEALSAVPSMLCPETRAYYKWLARTFRGAGVIVELGCWMGGSTCCLAEGLLQNPTWRSRKLYVFDSFVWLDWMKNHTLDPQILASGLQQGSSFLDYFWLHCRPYAEFLEVRRAAFNTSDDQFDLPEIEWPGEPIGLLVMDLADDRAVNEQMWSVFSPGFVSDNTVIVFNQYGNVRATELRDFCARRSSELIPAHKPSGSAKAFRYRKR